MTQDLGRAWTPARRPCSPSATPGEGRGGQGRGGQGRGGGGLQGVLPGKGREAGEGWRNRFRVSQGTTAVTTEGEEVENWVQPYTGVAAAESKQAVRNMRPLKIQ